LVLSLSEALDYVNDTVADHQLRVAYMATQIAKEMGFRGPQLRNIFHAAALHDIGLIRTSNRIRFLSHNELEGIAWHGEAGYVLLKDNEFFADAAKMVRYHHILWKTQLKKPVQSQPIHMGSYIICLADTVDRSINHTAPILLQFKHLRGCIGQNRENLFHPDCVKAFWEASRKPAFWLDVTSKRIYSIVNREVSWPTIMIDEQAMESISRIFARLVDSITPWVGTHSAGVAESAAALAQRLNFSPRKQILMRAAGYLHDLGKITVPSEILNKKEELTEEEWAIIRGHTYYTYQILNTIGGMSEVCEWAAYHHERLNGKGYPFGHDRRDLSLGARIMAVADTFTALTEDRPYRKGMSKTRTLEILDKLVAEGGLDETVVDVLREDFDAISSISHKAQSKYGIKQKLLAEAFESQSELIPAGPLV
jgi:HD-GYP domain-containing protein (c-di-GMP phosphodiesterase class II)